MIVLPDDIYSYIAYFLSLNDLKQFYQANRSISRNPLIKQQVFRLRLLHNVDCRPFMPTEVARNKQSEFRKKHDVEFWDYPLHNTMYKYLCYRFNEIIGQLFFSDSHCYFTFQITCHKKISPTKELKERLRALYPYANVKIHQIDFCKLFRKYYCLQIVYDTVPETYITVEQAEHDMNMYYKILFENHLL